jgi:APA family basic amino acid/polyamine antiporter
VPIVPILGVLVCGAMISQLDPRTLEVAFGWMIVGLIIYFAYSRRRSKLFAPKDVLPTADDFEKK